MQPFEFFEPFSTACAKKEFHGPTWMRTKIVWAFGVFLSLWTKNFFELNEIWMKQSQRQCDLCHYRIYNPTNEVHSEFEMMQFQSTEQTNLLLDSRKPKNSKDETTDKLTMYKVRGNLIKSKIINYYSMLVIIISVLGRRVSCSMIRLYFIHCYYIFDSLICTWMRET